MSYKIYVVLDILMISHIMICINNNYDTYYNKTAKKRGQVTFYLGRTPLRRGTSQISEFRI